jgi:hypothetical protein
MVMEGVNYQVAYKQEGGFGEVKDVRTIDLRFTSPSGMKIGDVFEAKSEKDLIFQPYFATYGNLDGDWVPQVGFIEAVEVVVPGKPDEQRSVHNLDFSFEKGIALRVIGFSQRKGLAQE